MECQTNILSIPFGDYISTDQGIKCGTVSWRRTGDLSIPSRAKIVGSYVNPAFSKTEAMLNGFDEAIVLTHEGNVSEGSAENLFMVRRGQLITPGVDQDILEGITRAGLIQLAKQELGLDVVVRSISTQRAVHRRRGLPVRHRRPDLAGHLDRPPADRHRRDRAGHREDVEGVLRCGPRPQPRLQLLADAGLLIRGAPARRRTHDDGPVDPTGPFRFAGAWRRPATGVSP